MKVAVLNELNNKVGELELPNQFEEEQRQDIIRRAVLVIQSHKRQPYSASSESGKRSSAKLSKRRRDYRGSYGFGISRVPRKIVSRRGTRMNWVGAFAPGTVGGRRAHPPKAEKIWSQKINKKERLKAIRSAITFTMQIDSVAQRGHKIPDNYPFILDGKFEEMTRTKAILQSLVSLGLQRELQRISSKKIRAGKGKSRGRKYKSSRGILIVVSKNSKFSKAAANIPGIDVADVKNLNAELLAPGGKPGRLTLWTSPAIDILKKENLFM
ncbi:50S ribosomal protein L4 [Candidatus Woesearchaeota archaeon]|nr:50S ribosomal protein L4 [Candidatus Woesearchaeota archaeon]